MAISYDVFTGVFLAKITEFNFINIPEYDRTKTIDGYMKRAITSFKTCKYDFLSNMDDLTREFNLIIPEDELIEIAEIVSEGMVMQWLRPYLYSQELLENMLNSKDFTTYSPAEMLLRVGGAYAKVQKDYTQMVREYSYNHGDLTSLHI